MSIVQLASLRVGEGGGFGCPLRAPPGRAPKPQMTSARPPRGVYIYIYIYIYVYTHTRICMCTHIGGLLEALRGQDLTLLGREGCPEGILPII